MNTIADSFDGARSPPAELQPAVDEQLNDVSGLARLLCGVPDAGVTLIPEGNALVARQTAPATGTCCPFCQHVVKHGTAVEVHDARNDPRFQAIALAQQIPGTRFYAGIPLFADGGQPMGVLYVSGPKPMRLSEQQWTGLHALARQATRLLTFDAARQREVALRQALFQQSELSRSMIESAGEAIISADLNGLIRSFNPAAERILGYAAEEVVGKMSAQQLHDPTEVQQAIDGVLREEGCVVDGFQALALPVIRRAVVIQESTYIRKDGSQMPVLLTISTLKNAAGTLTGFLAVAHDLSEKRALRSETAMNRAIITHAGVAIIATSLSGTITAFNPAAEELLGYAEPEMVGQVTPIAFHDPDEVERRAAELSRHYGEPIEGFETFVRPLREESAHTEVWTYIRKNGDRFPVTLTVSQLKDDIGRPVGYLGVARDQTEHFRQLEKDLAAAESATIVREAQERFLAGGTPRDIFAELLGCILAFTKSEFGFIGDVLHDDFGSPYLKTHAITDIAWNAETKALYAAHSQTGFEFRNLKTLFGAAMTTGAPVIANDPATDPRRGGLPVGHPAMNCFLCLPCLYGGTLVGLIGLANRPGGYDDEQVAIFTLLTSSTASLIQATRLEREREASATTLTVQEQRLRAILETAAECFLEVGPDGNVNEWNRLAVSSLMVSRDEALAHPIDSVLRLRSEAGQPIAFMDLARETSSLAGKPSEVVVILPDGTSFPAEIVIWPGPATTGYCAFLRNIAERKQLEEHERLLFQSETLLKEVHHRIKNNMQVISSLLSIQATKLQDEKPKEVFLECRERIRAMSLIHDKLYLSGKYEAIDFADYIREMVDLIVASNRPDGCQVVIDVSAEEIPVPVETAVPLSLIASELVLNCLKHGMTDRPRGRIVARLTHRDQHCELFVGDDGPGLAASPRDSGGTGLKLVDALARQIGGKAAIAFHDGVQGVVINWNKI